MNVKCECIVFIIVIIFVFSTVLCALCTVHGNIFCQIIREKPNSFGVKCEENISIYYYDVDGIAPKELAGEQQTKFKTRFTACTIENRRYGSTTVNASKDIQKQQYQ